MTLAERLLAKIEIDDKTGCWNWTASGAHGYGMIKDGRRDRRAHRVSYEIHRGPIPDGMLVCHECDNRACIRPDHLFLGTHAENMADRNAKKRQARGLVNGNAKLSEADVIAIRASKGETRRALAEKFGVCMTHISVVRSRKQAAE